MLMIDLERVLAICAGIITISGAASIIYRTFIKPYKDIKNQTRKCEERFKRDKDALDEIRSDMREMMDAVCTLLHHAATGNSVDKCREKHDKLVSYLAKK